jgi:DNA recombination protein RmuC
VELHTPYPLSRGEKNKSPLERGFRGVYFHNLNHKSQTPMNTLIIILGIIIIGALFYLIFLLSQKKDDSSTSASLKEIHENVLKQQQNLENQRYQLNELNKNVDQKLGDSHKAIQQQFGQSSKLITDVTEKLTQIDQTNKQVMGFANQLQSLENILKNPKQRGILGEYFLETVLKNVLPPNSYQMQYKFSDGDIVDAVVFVKDKIVPIDSKFSLENYNKIIEEKNETVRDQLQKDFKNDLKKRIDETSKYIRPNENTMDFAFMFIPSEGIFYDLLINQIGVLKISTRDLIEYAFKEKHVIIVSPTSFLAYLQTVLQGLRAMQMEDSVKEISKNVSQLKIHIKAYEQYFQKIGNGLKTTVGAYNDAYKEFGKIDKDVMRITGEKIGLEVELLDKPQMESDI